MADVAVLGLRVDATGAIVATQSLGKELNRLGGGAVAAQSKLAGFAKGFVTFASAAIAIRKVVDESRAAQDAQAQLEAAVQSTGGVAGRTVVQLQAMATSLQNVTRYSDEAVQGAQAILLTFTRIRGDQFDKATLAVANLAARMGGDLKGAALQLGKALNDPEKGLSALSRTGIQFSKEQARVITALAETGRMAEAQRIILAELETQVGGSAAAARNTLGGALDFVANKFGELFEVSRAGSGGIVGFLNSVGIALGVIKDNAAVFVTLAKSIGAAAIAYVAYSTAAKAAAVYTALLAATSTISAFISLAKGIRSAADAMALLSLVGKGAVGAVAAVAALAVGFVAYKKLASEVAKETEKFNAELGKLGTAQGVELPNIASAEDIARAKELAAANAERVRLAQQGLALARLTGAEAAEQVVRDRAINEEIKARGELKGRQLREAIDAIKQEESLGLDTVRIERAKQLNAENQDRVRLARQAYELVELEGEALARRVIEQDAINAEIAARRVLTGSELDASLRFIENEKNLKTEAAATNAILERRKLLLDLNNEAAKTGRGLAAGIKGDLRLSISDALADGEFRFESFFRTLGSFVNRMLSETSAALDRLFDLLDKATKAKLPTGAIEAQIKSAQRLQTVAGGAGIAIGAAQSGFQSGSAGKGFLSGAAGGAAVGSAAGPWGAAAGALIGGLSGMIGGMLGAAKAARENEAANKALRAAYALTVQSIRDVANGIANNLSQAIAEVRAQFITLRQQADSLRAPKGERDPRKIVQGNEAYVAALKELDALEAQRIEQIKKEAAAIEASFKTGNDILALRVQGLDAEADAMAIAQSIEEERLANIKAGISVAEASRRATLQTQIAEQELAKQRAAEAQRVARSVSDFNIGAIGFTDKRSGDEAALQETQRRRIEDAATAAEKLAAASYNAAEALAFYAARLEADTRTSESLISRVLNTLGDDRAAQDFTRGAQNRQEIADLRASGASQFNIDLAEFTQRTEDSYVRMQRAIEDGTKAINERAAGEIAALNVLAEVVQAAADAQLKALDDQIAFEKTRLASTIAAADAQIEIIETQAKATAEFYDQQIKGQQALIQAAQSALQVAESNLAETKRAYDALSGFSRSFGLSDQSSLSPTAKADLARAQFTALAEQARSGDKEAASQLPQIATAFLQASRTVNASGAAFGKDETLVRSTVDALTQQFGGALGADTAARDAAANAVAIAQTQLENLQALKDAAAEQAARDIAFQKDIKTAAEKAADAAISLLEQQKDKISADTAETLKRMDAQKLAIEKAAADQIAELVKNEQARHNARVALDPFYATAMAYYQRQIEAPGADRVTIAPVPVVSGPSATEQADSAALVTLTERQDRVIELLQQLVGVDADVGAQSVEQLHAIREHSAETVRLLGRTARTLAAQ